MPLMGCNTEARELGDFGHDVNPAKLNNPLQDAYVSLVPLDVFRVKEWRSVKFRAVRLVKKSIGLLRTDCFFIDWKKVQFVLNLQRYETHASGGGESMT